MSYCGGWVGGSVGRTYHNLTVGMVVELHHGGVHGLDPCVVLLLLQRATLNRVFEERTILVRVDGWVGR